MINRRKTKTAKLARMLIGSSYPIHIQSMTNTKTADIKSTVSQIHQLEEANCEAVRISIDSKEDARALARIKENIKIPLIADIQHNYKLALYSLEYGVDGLRLNPGNIKDEEGIKKVIEMAREKGVLIRIGANSGSVGESYLEKHKKDIAKALVECAYDKVRLLEDHNFTNIEISLKATDIFSTVSAYKMMAEKTSYPFHIGITEAGSLLPGAIKSAVGLGILLYQGIGDTLRVSLTDDPVKEVKVAFEILKTLSLREGITVISCPTCGRCKIDVIKITKEIEKEISNYPLRARKLKIAIMGCPVNGLQEAKHCDIGICGGKNFGLLFRHGKIIKKVKERYLISVLREEIKKEIGK